MKVMYRKFVSRIALILLGLTLLWCLPVLGQVIKGSISGTVVDSQNAAVAGAHVKVTQIETGEVFNTTSDGAGLFRLSLIPAGTYKIEVTAQGFKTVVQNNIPVTAGADHGLGSLQMSVGGTSETIEVVGTAPLVESTQAQVTNTFTGVALQQFAGVQENQGLDNLALFVPGVASVRDNAFSNTNGGAGFSSNGLRGRNNDQEIDGQNNNDNSVAGPALAITDPNWVQQYVIVTNNFGPEYGRNAGSVVNVITRSGGNAWHGSIYGNENNSVLNSLTSTQNSIGLTGPPRANDEFGGFTLGGPGVKNKFFMFGGFNQEIVSTSSVFSTGSNTPTPAGLATLATCFPTGPSSDAVSALTHFGPYGISAGNPTPANLTTATVGGCPGVQEGTVSRLLPTPTHIFNWITREDLQLGNDLISGRYVFARATAFNTADNGAAGYVVNVPALSQAVLLSWTHNLGSHMVNELRGGYDRLNVSFGGNTIGTESPISSLGSNITNVAFLNPGDLGYGASNGLPQGRFVNTWQVQDNWSYLWGKHTFKAGVNWTLQQTPNSFLPNINGQYIYNDLSSYVLQQPAAANIGIGNLELGLKEYDTFGYVGDDWKIAKNLTLNLGITYTYYGQPLNELNTLDTQNETGPNPLFNPALPLSLRVAPKISAYNTAIGPSFGFAYSPDWGGAITGNGKTTIRGGYRLLYDPPFYNIYLNNYTGSPNILSATLTPTAANPLFLPAVPTGKNVAAALSPLAPLGQLDPRNLPETAVPTDFRADQVHQWTLGMERQVTRNSALEVRYAGNHAQKLFQSVNANPFIADLAADFPNLAPSGVTPCADSTQPGFGRVNCNQGVVLSRNNSGFSNYNSLQASFRATDLFKQLTMQASYTYSKTSDNTSEIFGTLGAGNTVAYAQNPFNTSGAEYANSGLSIPNIWTLNFVEQLPFFKEQRGFMGHLLGGWGFSGDYIWSSGQPYTPLQVAFANLTEAGNFFDNAFLLADNGGAGVARPFLGSASAPVNTVGIFAGDACNIFGPASPACGFSANQLISLNALNATTPSGVAVNNNQVRFIANTGMAESFFGTPFGNAGRNSLRDAPANVANFTFVKKIKLGERAAFEFRSTFLNVFNHANFATVNPFVENAGNTNFGNAFAVPQLTGDSIPGSTVAASRRVYFGGTITF